METDTNTKTDTNTNKKIDTLKSNKVKSLVLKGFSKEEISKILQITDDELDTTLKEINLSDDITQNSLDLYSDFQKDLSKLVLTELNKENRDNTTILNAIKIQTNLQEKKLALSRVIDDIKINKDYIYERDEEISKLKDKGQSEEELSKQFKISIFSVKQSIDRFNLKLPDELKNSLTPSVISETMGLDKDTRIKILNQAYKEDLTRDAVRRLVNQIKNKVR
jgi:transposase